MKSKDLYEVSLGLKAPWFVEGVQFDLKKREVVVSVAVRKGTRWACPECRKRAEVHDSVQRRWRHLDTCEFRTFVVGSLPRVKCPDHGITTVRVPWAEERSRLTANFERLAIDLLGVCSVADASRILRMGWDQADGIKRRAVERGLERKRRKPIRFAAVDEKSIRRGHRYVSVVVDLSDSEKAVVDYVGVGRSTESLEGFWTSRPPQAWEQMEAFCMDLWPAYLSSAQIHLPGAEQKVVHDRYHLTTRMLKAVDAQRSREARQLARKDDRRLTGTKYSWLRNWENVPQKDYEHFDRLRCSALKTSRVWSYKEMLRDFWSYPDASSARDFFMRWYKGAIRSRLQPLIDVAHTFKRHLEYILNWFQHRISTAANEGVNAQIAGLIKRSCGFRNTNRFVQAIDFHFGGLDLYPRPLAANPHS